MAKAEAIFQAGLAGLQDNLKDGKLFSPDYILKSSSQLMAASIVAAAIINGCAEIAAAVKDVQHP